MNLKEAEEGLSRHDFLQIPIFLAVLDATAKAIDTADGVGFVDQQNLYGRDCLVYTYTNPPEIHIKGLENPDKETVLKLSGMPLLQTGLNLESFLLAFLGGTIASGALKTASKLVEKKLSRRAFLLGGGLGFLELFALPRYVRILAETMEGRDINLFKRAIAEMTPFNAALRKLVKSEAMARLKKVYPMEICLTPDQEEAKDSLHFYAFSVFYKDSTGTAIEVDDKIYLLLAKKSDTSVRFILPPLIQENLFALKLPVAFRLLSNQKQANVMGLPTPPWQSSEPKKTPIPSIKERCLPWDIVHTASSFLALMQNDQIKKPLAMITGAFQFETAIAYSQAILAYEPPTPFELTSLSFKVPVYDSRFTSEESIRLIKFMIDNPQTRDLGPPNSFYFQNLFISPDGSTRIVSDTEFKTMVDQSVAGTILKPGYTLPVGINLNQVTTGNPNRYDTRALNAYICFPDERMHGFITWHPRNMTPFHHLSSILQQIGQHLGFDVNFKEAAPLSEQAHIIGGDEFGGSGIVTN